MPRPLHYGPGVPVPEPPRNSFLEPVPVRARDADAEAPQGKVYTGPAPNQVDIIAQYEREHHAAFCKVMDLLLPLSHAGRARVIKSSMAFFDVE